MKATVNKQGDREIHIVREFDAPRDQVFAAMTDPALIPEWWGRHVDTTIVDEMDVRPGGRWRYVTRSDKGETAFRGEYREIVAPERLVQTFEWEGLPGHVSLDSAVFEELEGGRTRMTVVSSFDTQEDRDGMLDAGMEKGMNETYERFDALLARLAAR